ncbi:transcriptional regulator [Candidatus Saccharibacteria bacterium]|nr:transcriptional regulator [Candidatus Saccharibacteria bacterium]
MIDTLFGSKTRVKLLHLFLNNPSRSFYVREITRKIDEQINSVRRELANLQNIGIIKSDSSNNNRLYYEVNQEYVHFKPLKAIFQDQSVAREVPTGMVASDWKKRLKPLGDVRLAIFSGKLVKGSNSAADVLLVGDINKTQAKRFMKELEEDERLTLNYAVMSYDDFYYRYSIKDRFVVEVLDRSNIIHDEDGVLTSQQK